MKVGTDGVLLGSWAKGSGQCAVGGNNVLDIGTGTGLIALMLAQSIQEARIVAIEIDEAAVKQAIDNIQASLWSDRIEVFQADFRSWEPADGKKFELIVCNPPFFTRSLRNPDIQRATARHDDDLPLGTLIRKSARLLGPAGKLAIIIPAARLIEAMDIATPCGLHVSRQLNVRGNPESPVKRVLIEWVPEPAVAQLSELVIESGSRGVYSEAYRKLTGEFYPLFSIK